MAYIYKIINTINDKVYIGQTTKSIEDRFKEHIKESNEAIQGTRQSFPLFHRMIIYYGCDNFTVELVEECSSDMLDIREKYWINYYDSYNNGYNSTIGGRNLINTNINNKIDHPREVSQFTLNYEYIQTFDSASIAAKQIKVSASNIRKNCNKQSSNCAGYLWQWGTDTIFQGQKLQKNLIIRKKQYANKIVCAYNMDGSFYRSYNTIKEAAKDMHGYSNNICRACDNENASAYGYRWKHDCNLNYTIEPISKQSEVKTKKSVISTNPITLEEVEWENAYQAGKILGLRSSSIVNVCDGKFNTTGGLQWRYKI